MPKLPAFKQMVTRLAQVGSGAIATTKQNIANTTIPGPGETETAPPPLQIPDDFFRSYVAYSRDVFKFPRHPALASVHHALVRQPETVKRPEAILYPAKMITTVEVASTPTADTPGTCLVV